MKKLTQNLRAVHFAAVHNFAHDLDQLCSCAMTDDDLRYFCHRVEGNYA